MRRFFILLFFLQAGLISPVARGDPEPPATASRPVVFLPQWSPQAQFAGYYMAQEKGFYARRGLAVNIPRGGADYPPMAYLAEKKADFVTDFLVNAVRKKAEGLDLVNIAQIVQRSSLLLVAKKSSGIRTVQDFSGKKISIWSNFSLQPQALFRKYHLTVQIVPQTYSMNLLLRDAVSVSSAMWYNEYHTLINSGLDEEDLQVFFFSDYGLNFPEDGIYCLRETWLARRSLCCDFVDASLEGWRYAFEHAEETLDVVMRHVEEANIASNRMNQRWMLNRMRDIIMPSGQADALGVLREEDFDSVIREMVANQIISQSLSITDFHENCATR